MPSHPSMINQSSPLLRGIQVMSGLLIIGCSSYALFFNFLQLKSPKLLDKFRPPLTLPFIISPPAAYILFLSVSFQGLWSFDKGTQCPFRQRTALESPALAVIIFVAVINTTQAVQPVPREIAVSLQLEASYFFLMILSQSQPSLLSIIQSILLKASTKASGYFYYLYNLVFLS